MILPSKIIDFGHQKSFKNSSLQLLFTFTEGHTLLKMSDLASIRNKKVHQYKWNVLLPFGK
jgi:hypothetical protein